MSYDENRMSDLIDGGLHEQEVLFSSRDGFSIVVWNKKEDKPATNDEINSLINGDNEQLFITWNKVIGSEKDKGQIHLYIDSGEESDYEIRYISNSE